MDAAAIAAVEDTQGFRVIHSRNRLALARCLSGATGEPDKLVDACTQYNSLETHAGQEGRL